jgi:riboflavin-specific deaminase-like protein
MRVDPESIWQFLVDAAAHDFERDGGFRATIDGAQLQLDPDGNWRAATRLDEQALTMLDALAPLASAGGFVVAQLGQSLDGRIATASGHSHYINGPAGLAHLHRLRALADAVVVGAGTACEDRPQLTVRNVAGSDPARVIIDPRGRVPAAGPLFEAVDDPAPVLHLIGPRVRPETAPAHVRRIRLDPSRGQFEPAALVDRLRALGLPRLLIEGGSDTVSRFLQAGALDRLHLLIAPLIIGSGRPGIALPTIERLDEARRPPMRGFRLADELLVDVELASARD